MKLYNVSLQQSLLTNTQRSLRYHASCPPVPDAFEAPMKDTRLLNLRVGVENIDDPIILIQALPFIICQPLASDLEEYIILQAESADGQHA